MDLQSIARVVTLNSAMLKDLPTEEVFQFHPLIDPTGLPFRAAEKVKPIKVKPLSCILADDSVASHVLLATLEGTETLRANAYVCWGVDNDLWLQDEKKLHAKYNISHVDPDGWIHCEPKPEVPVQSAQVPPDAFTFGPAGGFSIIHTQWGDKRVIDGKVVYLHYGIANDFLCKGVKPDGTPDHGDIYRVALKFWKNTYEWK
jgi:hypothetical protein